jgi:hypothetical protein
MFTIAYDEERAFVRVAGTGTWSPVALAQFALEARRIEARHLVGRRDVRILGDARAMTVQPEPVALLCRTIVSRLLAKPGLRVALIASSALVKLQLMRTYEGLAVGIFATEEEALAYLEVPEVPDRATA